MIKPNAIAVWEGTGKTGKGKLTTGSKALVDAPYTFKTRFGSAPGTNPEELIAAAHAGCFTMKLAFNLETAGFIPTKLETSCVITFENGAVTASELNVEGAIPGISKEKFGDAIADAEKNCPISKLLNTHITAKGVLKT
ncbi:MAG: OsmC family peroxiredoxin [Prevotellaceae bacterium]|jgi:osmotically inducible protein OsmC|nr:OsmC family peroxiredoxin [Prevotellaceae bacterium]